MVNFPAPTKKGLVSRSTKSKPVKMGDNVSKVCFDIIPNKESLLPIGNIVLESTRSTKGSAATKSKPPMPR